MLPGDRLICAFAKPQAEAKFKAWPLHVTIVPWFRLAAPSLELAAEIEAVLAGTAAFEVIMAEETKLGHKKGKIGNWIAEPTQFMDIESRLRAVLKSHNAWLVDETTRQQRPFRAHVTAQAAERLQAGDRWHCDRLYIVEQTGDYKEIMAEIPLD